MNISQKTTQYFQIYSNENESSDQIFLVFSDFFQTPNLYTNTLKILNSVGSVIWITPNLSHGECSSWSPSLDSISSELKQICINPLLSPILITQGFGRQISSFLISRWYVLV